MSGELLIADEINGFYALNFLNALQDPLQNGLIPHRKEGFGHILGQGIKTRRVSRTQNDNLQTHNFTPLEIGSAESASVN
jgi:hypothetical protein